MRTDSKPVLAISAAVLLAVTGVLFAGPLNPPVGPVASTAKTLVEVEPRIAISTSNTPGDADSLFKITQSGSYYLTGNLTGALSKSGIKVVADGVTIDLNGFAMTGFAGTLAGIHSPNGTSALTVKNGSIISWGTDGINISGANSAIITGVSFLYNTGRGLNGNSAVYASDCTASGNGSDGISCGSYGTVINCIANQNGAAGIRVVTGASVSNCTATFNTTDGILAVGGACHIRSNTCTFNGSGGIGAGIRTTSTDNRIEDNQCSNADFGIKIEGWNGNFLSRNTCTSNSTNWDIPAGNVCLVINASTGGAILGNAGGVAPGSTDPNANFSY